MKGWIDSKEGGQLLTACVVGRKLCWG